jgi:hypothetical protein
MKTHKCIIVIPAGRKRYIEILLPYILKEKNFIDEMHIWMNTNIKEDIVYLQQIAEDYKFIKLKYNADKHHKKGKSEAIHTFFTDAIDDDSIYIRLDDDIVWLENNFIEKLYYYRLNNPQYFLIYPNIINNAIIDHIRWRFGCFENKYLLNNYHFSYKCTDPIGWQHSEVAYLKHQAFLDDLSNNNLDHYRFYKWILFHFERVSINCISWFGSEFKKFDGNVGSNEEQWLSVDHPKNIKKPNCIFGDIICSHFSFYTQRAFLDNTDLLYKYQQLVN